ncbi:hypothetical protein ACFE04_005432 [Oxalis oulophora]
MMWWSEVFHSVTGRMLLSSLRGVSNLPWLVGGDFNEILNHSEMKGGRRKSDSQIQDFRQVVDDCELREIMTGGPCFTWKNNRRGDEAIFEKLDRVLANDKWSDLFPNAASSNLVSSISDHLPVLLDTELISGWSRPERMFKFENFWVNNDLCFNEVRDSWFADKDWSSNIQAVQRALCLWSSKEYGNVAQTIKHKQNRLGQLLVDVDVRESEEEIKSLEIERAIRG